MATLLLQWRSTEHYGQISTRFASGDPVFTQHVQAISDALGGGAQAHAAALAQLGHQLADQATLLACLDYFQVIAVIGLIGATVSVLRGVRARMA